MEAFRAIVFVPLFSSAQAAILLVDVHRRDGGTAEDDEEVVVAAAGTGAAASAAARVEEAIGWTVLPGLELSSLIDSQSRPLDHKIEREGRVHCTEFRREQSFFQRNILVRTEPAS